MRKFSIKILAASLTFFVGAAFSICWNVLFLPFPEIDALDEETIACNFTPTFVSICQLNDSPDSFDGKQVMTEATLYASGSDENVLYPINCFQTGSEIHWTFLELKEFKKLHAALRIKEPYYKEVDVRVIGTVKKIYDKNGESNYLIVPDSIEIISPFRKFTAKGAA